jgi:hypothetical protein
MIEAVSQDRVGLGWRRELSAGILAHLDRIDLVEVIADDLFEAPKNERRALRTLAAQTPVVLHGVSLGLASIVPAEARRLEKMARLCEEIQPEFWSEHLAFVRGGGIEIGHLTAPPRTPATIEGTAENLRRARRIVGSAPLVENIATLIDPPGSTMAEIPWLNQTLRAAGADLLLDLHNLYANGLNFGFDPIAALDHLPMDRLRAVHLAGGRWIGSTGAQRLLDDHLHDVPEAVYELLTCVGARASQPITVLLERDGKYPPIEILLDQLDRARTALASGRAMRTKAAAAPDRSTTSSIQSDSPGHSCEAFLATIYTEEPACKRFLADPRGEATRAGLNESEIRSLENIDRLGLALASQSLERKRSKRIKRIFAK